MTKGAFPLVELDETTIEALRRRAPVMPLEGFRCGPACKRDPVSGVIGV